ncbi:MAG TPA: ABC transporter ATP-binding protein [Solirubrobacterales bacterium]|nr:ABC transporter ATP-binding protein [Solirubrobacterales bacterium]
MGSEAAIQVTGLRKAYGENEAVRGIDFEVARGEVFGFLGPNGAGKTTTIEILEGYRERTAGDVSVLGVDPGRATREWRSRIGLVLQECELNPLLTVAETMRLYSSFFPNPRPADETLDLVGLGDRHKARVGSLSGGQQRRLDVGVGIVGNPELLFLDEPTTGFDPSARRDAWNMIEGLKDLGTTIVLTTHYMEEAQHLADRVVILREGRIVAAGAPATLGDQLGQETIIRFRLTDGLTPDQIASAIGRRPEISGNEAKLASTEPQRDLHGLLDWAEGAGVQLADLEVRRPSLEDVFLEVTGDGSEEKEQP